MVVLDNVSKTFKDKTVLQKTSLTIESGRITGFIGRNGSGKTVLFKLICGLMLPTTGTVTALVNLWPPGLFSIILISLYFYYRLPCNLYFYPLS